MSLVGTLSLKDLNLTGTLSQPGEINGKVNTAIDAAGTISNSYFRGYSAYEIAVQHGYTGTEAEFVEQMMTRDATETTKGIMKLYNSTGENTDGSMTQRATTHAINDSTDSISYEELMQILV